MNSVGAQIRVARLQAGLSLEQVAGATCIPIKTLQAIENDDLSAITSAFFYKSFVRQFAQRVGLSYESLAASVTAACSTFPEQVKPGQGEAIIRNSVVHLNRRPRILRWLYPIGSLAMVLVACSGFYAYWHGHLNRVLESTVSAITEKSAAAPARAAARSTEASNSAGVELYAPSDGDRSTEADGRFHVQLSAVERTWLSIQADGKMVYSGTLEVDQTKMIEGRDKGQVRTGNAGGVSIVFNGKPIGLAGPHGSVRTVVFTRDNYQVLPAAEHTAFNLMSSPIAEWWLPRLRR